MCSLLARTAERISFQRTERVTPSEKIQTQGILPPSMYPLAHHAAQLRYGFQNE